MIADAHCHYPMHLLKAEEEHPHDRVMGWLDSVKGDLRGEVFSLVADVENSPSFAGGWRVDSDGLRAGDVGIVCSVLYRPFGEFSPGLPLGAPPDAGAFDALMAQLEDVEEHVLADAGRNVIVHGESDLDDPRMRFVHCVEGGFHLGPDPELVDGQVQELAERGVFYITLAHLFYRGVAADAPAIPPLSDAQYNAVFRQPAMGLPRLGRRALQAMWEHRVVMDLSHMRRDVVVEALWELDGLDPGRTMPVIASHVGAASAGPPDHAYNLTPDTMRSIAARDGVIGVIVAQHLMGDTATEADSRELLRQHIDAIRDATGSHQYTGIGSDLDGFIKPTLAGIERAADLAKLEGWIRELYPADAEAILHGNVERVLRKTLRLRAAQ